MKIRPYNTKASEVYSLLGRVMIVIFIVAQQLAYAQSSKTTADFESYYVPAVDGTQLAVDVFFPKNYQDQKLPALFVFTRYWRSKEHPETGEPMPSLRKRDQFFLANDYILVKVDARGTGASYGTRPGEYTPTEVEDARYVVEWAVSQSWSDGKVGAYGTSYSGTTAELLCATGHKAVKAVIPGWSDFDVYESPVRPYGMLASVFIAPWSEYVNLLDQNATDILKSSVRRVGKDFPGEAITGHKNNPIVLEGTRNARYKDSKFADFKFEECDPLYWKKEISESKVPMLVLTSWLDAGTAKGTLLRLKHYPNPQKVVMMPTAHGGFSHASPFRVADKAVDPVPSVSDQLQLQLDFFDEYLKDKDKGVKDWPTISYYNLGEEAFRESEVWPPTGQSKIKYFLNENERLTRSAPRAKVGSDQYTVDFSVSTGTSNRWATQMGQHILNLDNRNGMDSLMLTYTTQPMSEDVQITGTPVISLQISSTHEEGAVFVYLEDVDETGRSRYITEGGLLLEHRKLSIDPNFGEATYHSFRQADAAPMEVDKVEEITFKLWPISILIKKGHSIRIALAGADKDTFDRVPVEGTPTYTVSRNRKNLSFIELPIIE